MEGQRSEGLTCAIIQCNIFQLPGDGNAEVFIDAYLDERFFAVSLHYSMVCAHKDTVKLSREKNTIFMEKTFVDCSLLPKDTTLPNFVEKTFANS